MYIDFKDIGASSTFLKKIRQMISWIKNCNLVYVQILIICP